MSIEIVKFKSLESYIEEITKRTLEKEKVVEHQLDSFWFRGHSDDSWDLSPKLYRKDFLNGFGANEIEEALINDFISNYYIHDKNISLKKWDILVKMQHHGIPTRILDWSESALISLFFAIERWDLKKTPCVWSINPCQLNKVMTGKDSLFFSEGESYNDWLPGTIRSFYKPTKKKIFPLKKNIGKVPIALNYKHSDVRSLNQKGTAIIFPTNIKRLDTIKKIVFYKYVLDFQPCDADYLKKYLLSQLDLMGLNSLVAYPDLQGLNTFLSWKHTGKLY